MRHVAGERRRRGAFNNRGIAYFELKNYDLAIADYDEMIRRDLRFAVPFNNCCVANLAKQNYDQALDDCNKAIQLDGTNAVAFNSRADV